MHKPGMSEARGRLVSALNGILAHYVSMICINPTALHADVCLRMDTLQPVESRPTTAHWAAMVQEVRLSAQQERQVLALLDQWHATTNPWFARRDQLLAQQQQQQAGGHSEEGAERLLRDIERCQIGWAWHNTATMCALMGGLLSPEQSASAVVAAYPYVPTLLAIEEGLHGLIAARQGASQSQGALAAEGSGWVQPR